MDGSIPAQDYLWRQYETLKPIGVATTTIVDREYRKGPGDGIFVIDDFQSESSLGTSSSGGTVVYDVQDPWEGLMDDTDGTFTWAPGDPMNGMARGRTNDLTKGVVFDWSVGNDRYLEYEMMPAMQPCKHGRTSTFRSGYDWAGRQEAMEPRKHHQVPLAPRLLRLPRLSFSSIATRAY